ncbi:MAG: TVP38/TMEM64 family protein [Thermodesulfobacteriota bacterium]
MNESGAGATPGRAGARLRAAALALFLLAAGVLLRFTPLQETLTPDRLGRLIEAAGLWAPAIFILVYALGVCVLLPGTLLAAVGAGLFGPYQGFVYVWTGAMIGAGLAFLIARYLGREFAASMIGDRLKKYDQALERHGFATVLYLRLIYFPFNILNFGMGLTAVRFRDYFWGTALGILAGTFIFTFFFGTLKEVWAGGRWTGLLSGKVFFSLGLFVFSFFIPILVKRLKRKPEETGGEMSPGSLKH